MDTPLLTTPQDKFAKENATDSFRKNFITSCLYELEQ